MTTTTTDGNGTTHFFDVYPAKRTRNVNETIGRSSRRINNEPGGFFLRRLPCQ
ncbi:MAG TPA: hypothetical protein VE914_10535 [Candidatus Angelobacter sp.]|nr:hypothetical protein [Candidatus Angelobacter sp.]